MKAKLTKVMLWVVGVLVLTAMSAVGYKTLSQKETNANLEKARTMIADDSAGQGSLA
jgi:hypothetical protein